MHIGLEIAYVGDDGTMVKVKAQTEEATTVDHGVLAALFAKAASKTVATYKIGKGPVPV